MSPSAVVRAQDHRTADGPLGMATDGLSRSTPDTYTARSQVMTAPLGQIPKLIVARADRVLKLNVKVWNVQHDWAATESRSDGRLRPRQPVGYQAHGPANEGPTMPSIPRQVLVEDRLGNDCF
jgi:hypothetical protein